ncbi:MAG: low molecular weight phosphotyrosine protein phosphatase [Paramuribaculum sp.]|nr:low molecular weight phosphotyrosine protein phosphatase [Paramuribaculum sp.]MDE6487984.1 low molecular weight phosphotyrosine protein phosphatase [Paramuribaculum sp.]
MNLLEFNDNPRIRRAIAQIENPKNIKVLFVCLGNICRSPAAEGLMRQSVIENGTENRWEIDSAGTGNYHIGELPDPRMRAHARRRGLELDHRCRQVSESDFYNFDLIIAMDSSNYANLRRIAPTAESQDKILQMAEFFDSCTNCDHVPDPYYDGADGFELVLDLLTAATRNLRDTVETNSLA